MKQSKVSLREYLWKAQKEVSLEARHRSDQALLSKLLQFIPLLKAKTIFLFVGVSPEPETLPWIESFLHLGKTVAVPFCFELEYGIMEARHITATDQLVPGKFGILEPRQTCPVIEKENIDVALVPAVCFSRDGFRLGRGGGYYDRWLQGYQGISIGICRRQFLQEHIPVEPHDQKVNYILIEDGIIAL